MEKEQKMEMGSGAGSKGGVRKPKPKSEPEMKMASAAGSKGGVRKPKPKEKKEKS